MASFESLTFQAASFQRARSGALVSSAGVPLAAGLDDVDAKVARTTAGEQPKPRKAVAAVPDVAATVGGAAAGMAAAEAGADRLVARTVGGGRPSGAWGSGAVDLLEVAGHAAGAVAGASPGAAGVAVVSETADAGHVRTDAGVAGA